MQTEDDGLTPEDILSSSLQTIYAYEPISHSSPGSIFSYTPSSLTINISLRTPDTNPGNWALHATSIWASSLFLADHLDDLHLEQYPDPLRVLELGAGAGLPGILVSKVYQNSQVTVSDYPDEQLIETLSENIIRNDVSSRCQAVPYAWGSDPSLLFYSDSKGSGFDVVMAADTLWNPDSHALFIEALRDTLKKTTMARIHLIAGLHTGRYTLKSFLTGASSNSVGFDIDHVTEREVNGTEVREWDADRIDDERERRRWVLWITLKWKIDLLDIANLAS